ncbi:LOW QUALITY PROTEIN: luc7-like protein 3 [Ctenocephalides felis]|uniref:LOW QUALITY PROTEIN: luc7-like protein 3 n=1 Tax=Ctenocephalides felis TaxID=7515 RepID=UPI000E6E1D47|nr:LOW QUALITY PROTEIN: luc7-like protein 3 [Ctenocephalides felis]
MCDAARALLDELMGRNRNADPTEKRKELNWEDPEYCKYFIVRFCPHDLFTNTRADLGLCPKIHDEEAKKLYKNAKPSHRKTFYEDEFLRFCQNMIGDVDRKIVKGRQRLALMNKSDGEKITPAQTKRNQDQINMLTDKIAQLEREAEAAGTRGDVEQAQGLMKLCDTLKEEKEGLLNQNDNSHWSMTAELAAAQEKQMEVCTICGAFLIVGDAQQRIDDHLMGKQHLGYARLREAVEELTEERKKERESLREKERERRKRDEEKDTRRRKEKERSREKERDDRKRDRDDKKRNNREKRDDYERERDRSRRDYKSERTCGVHPIESAIEVAAKHVTTKNLLRLRCCPPVDTPAPLLFLLCRFAWNLQINFSKRPTYQIKSYSAKDWGSKTFGASFRFLNPTG